MALREKHQSIFLLDKSALFRRKLSGLLKEIKGEKFELIWSRKPSAGLKKISKTPPLMIIIDHDLIENSYNGFFRKIEAKISYVSLILVGDSEKSNQAHRAILERVDEFILKSEINENTILRCLRYAQKIRKIRSDNQENINKYRTLFDLSPVSIVVTDLDSKIVEANPTVLNLLGYKDKGKLLGKNGIKFLAKHMVKPDLKFLKMKFKELLKKGFTSNVYHLCGIDNREIYVQSSSKLVKDKNNKPIFLFITFVDITFIKAMENALLESEAKFKQIFESSPMGIILTDLDGNIIECNGKILDLFDFKDKKSIIGKVSIDRLFPVEYQDIVIKQLHLLVEKKFLYNEYFLTRQDDSPYYVESYAIVIKDFQSQPKSLMFLIQDITHRKIMEKEQNELFIQLENRTKELRNFVYTVSHDLKAPLVSIDGFTSILINRYNDILDEKGLHYLRRTRSNVENMEGIISHLLELSRIGRVIGEKESINIRYLVDKIVREYQNRERVKKIQYRISTNFPIIMGDSERIRQVFENLIDNAIKFLGNQLEPLIEIGTMRARKDTVKFYVKDNGIGIDKRYHEKIFEIFHRLNDLETKGTGVGLSIVKRIIEHHNGRIWLESENGKGTTFFFSLSSKGD